MNTNEKEQDVSAGKYAIRVAEETKKETDNYIILLT